jgi:hypothetical protein
MMYAKIGLKLFGQIVGQDWYLFQPPCTAEGFILGYNIASRMVKMELLETSDQKPADGYRTLEFVDAIASRCDLSG